MPIKCTRRPVKRLAERDSIRDSRTTDDIEGGIVLLCERKVNVFRSQRDAVKRD